MTFPTLSFPFSLTTPFASALLTPHPIEPNWVQPCHYGWQYLTKYVSYDRHFILINISRSRSLRPVGIEAKKREIRIFSPIPLSFSNKKLKREILQDLKVYIYHDTYYQKRLGGGAFGPIEISGKKAHWKSVRVLTNL